MLWSCVHINVGERYSANVIVYIFKLKNIFCSTYKIVSAMVVLNIARPMAHELKIFNELQCLCGCTDAVTASSNGYDNLFPHRIIAVLGNGFYRLFMCNIFNSCISCEAEL